jgi:hypothetical protein
MRQLGSATPDRMRALPNSMRDALSLPAVKVDGVKGREDNSCCHGATSANVSVTGSARSNARRIEASSS